MFRKSAVDITRLIKRALDVDVSLYSSSELLICNSIFNEPIDDVKLAKLFAKLKKMKL